MSKKLFIVMILSSILSFLGCKEKKESEKEKTEMELMFEKSIEEFNNRKIYKKLTPKILESIPDDKLEQAIFDNIYEIIGDDYENELSNVKKLSKGQQAFFSTWIIEGEVNNGGFNQFYFNSSGQYAEMAVVGFRTIGAEKFADLTSRANKLYSENEERLKEFDDGTTESFSESYKNNPLNDLDTEFYELYDDEKIGILRVSYIRKNPNEFITN